MKELEKRVKEKSGKKLEDVFYPTNSIPDNVKDCLENFDKDPHHPTSTDIMSYENTPPKLRKGHQPTPNKHTEPDEEKVPGEGGKIQMSKSTYADAEKQKHF